MKRFGKILCVVDTGINSEAAIVQAVKIANDHQAELTFAAVIKASGTWPRALRNKKEISDGLQSLVENKRDTVKRLISETHPDLNANIEIYSGIEFIEIIKSVTKNQFDLLVKCAEDFDWLQRLFGGNDMHLLRKCPCSVLMLKPGQTESFRSILATVDVSEDLSEMDNSHVQWQLNKKVLEYSAACSVSELTELHVGSAWEALGEGFYRHGVFTNAPEEDVDLYVEQVRRECSDRLDLLVKEFSATLGKETVQYLLPKLHLVKGQPAREIPLLAEKYKIDLVVMGTVGRIGIPGLIIGNTAETILEQVSCSVLAIKPDGFETPVL